jgi:hypothetical protein
MIFPLLIAASVSLVPVAEYDIPWYQSHPAERAEILGACHNDHRNVQSFHCRNAELADTREEGKRHKAVTGPADLFPVKPARRVKGDAA